MIPGLVMWGAMALVMAVNPPVVGGVPVFPWATDGLEVPMARDNDFHRGASLGLFVHERDPFYQRYVYTAYLEEMAAAGITHVQFIVRWTQDTVKSVKLQRDLLKEADDAMVGWVIEEAVRRGLKPYLMPTVHVLDHSPGSWRGAIAPDDWDAWWGAYIEFVLHYARIAQAHGAVLYAVGSELVSTEVHEARWRDLIGSVREVYEGELTYSANWDHYEPVKFWDALDVVGVNAYPPISRLYAPTEEQLVLGWQTYFDALSTWSRRHGYRFIFTEVGYPSNVRSASHPWLHGEGTPADIDLQLRCYRALYRVWQSRPELKGLYLWNWFGKGGVSDAWYTPRGKPAEEVVRHWYMKSKHP